jgi:hypothetical protein
VPKRLMVDAFRRDKPLLPLAPAVHFESLVSDSSSNYEHALCREGCLSAGAHTDCQIGDSALIADVDVHLLRRLPEDAMSGLAHAELVARVGAGGPR